MEGHNNYRTTSGPDGSGAHSYTQLNAMSPTNSQYPQQQYQQSFPGQGENAPEYFGHPPIGSSHDAPEYAGHAPAGSGHDAPEVVHNQYHELKPPPLSPDHTQYQYSATDGNTHWSHPDDTNKVAMPYGVPVDSGKEMYTNGWQQNGGAPQHYAGAPGAPAPAAAAAAKPKSRRRLFIIIGVVAVVVIAIVAGVTAGVLVSRKSSSTAASTSGSGSGSGNSSSGGDGGSGGTGSGDGGADNTTTTATSKCNKTVCNQIFAAAPLDSDVHLFAVGSDQAMWTNVIVTGTTPGGWSSLGGQFRSQPAAVYWNDSNPTINVFASAAAGGNVAVKNLTGGTWSSDWRSMNKVAASAVGACRLVGGGMDRADIFVRSTGGTTKEVVHDWWDTPKTIWADLSQAQWDSTEKGDAAGAPAVACRDSLIEHDLAIYDRSTGTVQHNQWNATSGGWKGWESQGGSFVGDPVLVSPSSSRVDFFGLGSDSALWHFSWTESDLYSTLDSLGGEFESMPAVVATSSGRYDIVAVGTDDKLKHGVFTGSSMSGDWEDLGVFSNSAPFLYPVTSSQLGLFILGEDDDVLFSTWTISDDTAWVGKMSDFASTGGNLTSTWLIL